MHQLEFAGRYGYPSQVDGIRIPVTLQVSGKELEILAFVDTGATYCLFQREYADLLGLDLEAGHRLIFSTVAGTVEAFGHTITMEFLGIVLEATVFFFANERIQKNVLGRNGWLNRIRLGLVDYEQQMFLAPYEPNGPR